MFMINFGKESKLQVNNKKLPWFMHYIKYINKIIYSNWRKGCDTLLSNLAITPLAEIT